MANKKTARQDRPKGKVFEWRVPARYRDVEPRERVRITLYAEGARGWTRETENLKRGLIEEWERRLDARVSVGREQEAAAARLAVASGFSPRSQEALLADPDIEDLLQRLEYVRRVTPAGAKPSAELVRALLEGSDMPVGAAAKGCAEKISAFFEHDARVNVRKAEKQNRVAVQRFVKYAGDKPMADISPVDAELLLIGLRREAAERTRTSGDTAHTIKRRFVSLKGIWTRWARRSGVEGKNPFSAVELDAPRAAQEGRLAFHRWHLSLIEANARGRTETLAQIALMKRTGIGPYELAGLTLEDLYLNEEIPFIHVRDNARRTLDKGAGRSRRIPVVGLSADDVRAALVVKWNENAANALSQKLNKVLRAAGVPRSSRLTCYSFRHGFKQALRAAAVPLVIQDRLMGHASESGAAANYGNRSARLAAKRDAIAAALPLLGDLDACDFTPDELPLAVR